MIPITLLQIKNLASYEKNLAKLIEYITQSDAESIIVAPELYITDFDYDNIDAACKFSEYAIKRLSEIVTTQTVILTFFRKIDSKIVNQAVAIHNRTVVHTQNKYKLFKFGNEDKHFSAGDGKDIEIFEVNGLKIALLICFELRFKELWHKLEGADIICIPSQWGEPRKRHLEILGSALAVMNQCYVAIANSSNSDMAKSTALYAPMGGVVIDDASESIQSTIDLKQIKFMRKYLNLN